MIILPGSDLAVPYVITLFVLVFLTLEFVNYNIFVKNSFYREVIERFERENRRRKSIWRGIVLTATAVLVYSLF
jgi:dolichol kinase